MKSTCRQFASSLSLLAAGCLPEPERATVAAHVSVCPACAVRLAGLRSLTALLAAEGQSSMEPEFSGRCRARLRAALLAPRAAGGWRVPAAAGTGLLTLILGFSLGTAFLAPSGQVAYHPLPTQSRSGPAERPSPQEPAALAPGTPPCSLLTYRLAAQRSDAALERQLARDADNTLPPVPAVSLSTVNF